MVLFLYGGPHVPGCAESPYEVPRVATMHTVHGYFITWPYIRNDRVVCFPSFAFFLIGTFGLSRSLHCRRLRMTAGRLFRAWAKVARGFQNKAVKSLCSKLTGRSISRFCLPDSCWKFPIHLPMGYRCTGATGGARAICCCPGLASGLPWFSRDDQSVRG